MPKKSNETNSEIKPDAVEVIRTKTSIRVRSVADAVRANREAIAAVLGSYRHAPGYSPSSPMDLRKSEMAEGSEPEGDY
jgi:hypothetical protein